MAIQDILNKLISEPFMFKMRQHIVDGLEQVYKDATAKGDTNMEVLRARGSSESLNDRLNIFDKNQIDTTNALSQKASINYVDAILMDIAKGGPNSGPNGPFMSLAALKSYDFPSGKEGTWLVFDSSFNDGAHSFMWDSTNSDWKDLGVYQAMGIADESIETKKYAPKSVTPEKTSMFEKVTDYENLVSEYVPNASIDVVTGLIKTNASWTTKVSKNPIPVTTGDVIRTNGTSNITVAEYNSSYVFLRATTAASITIGSNTAFSKYQYGPEVFAIVKNANIPTSPNTINYLLKKEHTNDTTTVGFNYFNKNDIYPISQYTIKSSGKIEPDTGVNARVLVSKKIAIPGGSIIGANVELAITVHQYRKDTSYINASSNLIYKGQNLTLEPDESYIHVTGQTLADIEKLVIFKAGDTIPTPNFPVAYQKESTTPANIEVTRKSLGLDTELITPKKQYVVKNADNPFFFIPMQRKFLQELTTRIYTQNYIANAPNIINTLKSSWLNLASDESRYGFYLFDSETQPLKKYPIAFKTGDLTKNTGEVVIAPIGDSLTDLNGQYKYAKDNAPNLSFVGMLKDTITGLNHEGRPGWTLEQYMTINHSPVEWAGFSPFLHPKTAGYKYYGDTKFWISCYGGDTYNKKAKPKGDELGGFNVTTGLRNTPNINDVMYNYANARYEVYNGSAWVVITEAVLGGFEFNYSKYLSTWNITQPNIVSIMLGTNDYGRVNWYDAKNILNPKFTSWYNTIIASVRAVSSTIKVALLIPPYKSTLVGTTNDFVKENNLAFYENRKNIITVFDNREVENIYVVDVGSAVDTENDFGIVTQDAVTNGSKKPWMLGKVSDVTHPVKTGFDGMGMRFVAFVQVVR